MHIKHHYHKLMFDITLAKNSQYLNQLINFYAKIMFQDYSIFEPIEYLCLLCVVQLNSKLCHSYFLVLKLIWVHNGAMFLINQIH